MERTEVPPRRATAAFSLPLQQGYIIQFRETAFPPKQLIDISKYRRENARRRSFRSGGNGARERPAIGEAETSDANVNRQNFVGPGEILRYIVRVGGFN